MKSLGGGVPGQQGKTMPVNAGTHPTPKSYPGNGKAQKGE